MKTSNRRWTGIPHPNTALLQRSMKNQHRRILAIDPGTRFMGIAFLDNGKLIYHTVKVFPKGGSPQETPQRARDAVLRFINDLEPQVIAVERTFFSQNRNTALLNVLFDEIRSIARRKKLAFLSYAPSTVKKFTCGNGWAGKKEVATVIVGRFPELKPYLHQTTASKERFHQNMFDAVALAIMAAKHAA
jgi:Holliday junction resolvasome RuvABC endonuclease subunit